MFFIILERLYWGPEIMPKIPLSHSFVHNRTFLNLTHFDIVSGRILKLNFGCLKIMVKVTNVGVIDPEAGSGLKMTGVYDLLTNL